MVAQPHLGPHAAERHRHSRHITQRTLHQPDMYNAQNYMKFGVVTDEDFHVFKEQSPILNFRAIGAVVGAHDALKEESGAGVSILSALKVAFCALYMSVSYQSGRECEALTSRPNIGS